MRTGEESPSPFLGRLLRLQLQPGRRVIWLGAAWAALCGAVASGRLTLSRQDLLSLGLLLFLADPLLGAVWSALEAIRLPGEVHSSSAEAHLPPLPYTRPGSPGDGVFAHLNATVSWWRADAWPQMGTALVGLMVASALALAIGLVLGRWVALLTTVALASPFVAMALLGQHPLSEPFTRALPEIGLAWLLGYALFQDLSLPPNEATLGTSPQASALAWLGTHGGILLLAGLYTITYYACLILHERSHLVLGLALLNGAQLTVALLLVAVRQPILAGWVGLLLISQVLFQPLLRRQGARWYLERTQFFLMGSMLVAALGI